MASAPEPVFADGAPPKVGVLLVNLGTPDAPTPEAVKRYLAEFLSDPRVVEIPRLLWLPILHGVILRTRPKQSAAKYAAIWTKDGSPLRLHTERQAQLLRGYLGARPLVVRHAMRYGTPSIAQVLADMSRCERILICPLYPQYAASTTASVMDAVNAFVGKARNAPELRAIKHFHDHPGYIDALKRSVLAHWEKNRRSEMLLMSFHGLPRYTLERGDPYHDECHETAKLLAESLGLRQNEWRVSFQSRFGRTEWLKPYTSETLQSLAKDGLKRVDVICPGFVSDCLETLEEIALEAKALFLEAGGKEFHVVPCLNENPEWIAALGTLVEQSLQGWLGGERGTSAARAMGAGR